MSDFINPFGKAIVPDIADGLRIQRKTGHEDFSSSTHPVTVPGKSCTPGSRAWSPSGKTARNFHDLKYCPSFAERFPIACVADEFRSLPNQGAHRIAVAFG